MGNRFIFLRLALAGLSLLGTVFFTTVLIVSFADPIQLERAARELLRIEVQRRVSAEIGTLDEKFLSSKAGKLIERHAGESTAAARQLAAGIPEKVAKVVGEMTDASCECRKQIAKAVEGGLLSQIAVAQQAQARLTDLIRTKYRETAAQLLGELRIFSGANALVFALLGIALRVKPLANLHLVPAAIVLLVAAAATGYVYLFEQNWLHSIVYADYVGFAYFGYLGITFVFLCDVIFNKARVTCNLLARVLDGVSISPC